MTRTGIRRDFGGEPLGADEAAALERLTRDGPAPRLCELLTPAELTALGERASWLVHLQALPELVDDGGWPPYPWPLV